jgi:hypothetical protein
MKRLMFLLGAICFLTLPSLQAQNSPPELPAEVKEAMLSSKKIQQTLPIAMQMVQAMEKGEIDMLKIGEIYRAHPESSKIEEVEAELLKVKGGDKFIDYSRQITKLSKEAWEEDPVLKKYAKENKQHAAYFQDMIRQSFEKFRAKRG